MILFNNQFLANDLVPISVFSPTLNYGNGVFETLRTYEKKIFKTKEHIDRLFFNAEKISVKIKYSPRSLEKMLRKIKNKFYQTNKSKNFNRDLKIKIIVIEEGVLITAKFLDFSDSQLKSLQKIGVNCKSFTAPRSLAEVKSISYLSSYYFHNLAEQMGYFEALLCDKEQEVLEGAYSNFFWFEDEKLFTNPVRAFLSGIAEDELSYEFLHGITRETIINLINNDNKSIFSLNFKSIKLSELKEKDEVFLTQTTRGIVPIFQIDDKFIGKSTPDSKCFPRTLKLIEKFEDCIKNLNFISK